MKKHLSFAAALGSITLLFAPGIRADAPSDGVPGITPKPAAAPEAAPSTRPGPGHFESRKAGGIGFDTPAGMSQVKLHGAVENIARYTDEDRHWVLDCVRIVLPESADFLNKQDTKALRDHDEKGQLMPAKVIPGILDSTVATLQRPPLRALVLRRDVIQGGKTAELEVAMVAARYMAGPKPFLRQQALVKAYPYKDHTSRLYYMLEMTTPSTDPSALKEGQPDALERDAVAAFRRVVDSVELFNLTSVNDDINDRLDATRLLYLNIGQRDKIEPFLDPEHGVLIYIGEKIIGYRCLWEEVARRDGHDGIVIGVRERREAPNTPKVEIASELFSTFDRKYETWANIAITEKPVVGKKGEDGKVLILKDQVREVGSTNTDRERVFLKEPDGRTKFVKDTEGKDTKQPLVTFRDIYKISVTQLSKAGVRAPITQSLPISYLPQAMDEILPRLVGREPKKYCVCQWVSGDSQVWRRFIDVEPDRLMTWRGKEQHVVVIQDRLGIEGPLTEHYYTSGGKYLGSYNKELNEMLLPATAEEIKSKFVDANLAPPHIDQSREVQPND